MTGATHAPFLGTFTIEPVPAWEREINAPTFLRRPRRLELVESGEMEEGEEQPGVSAVHWAPIRSRWTTEPPTCEGYWWVRASGTRPVVVLVERDEARHLVFVLPDLTIRRVPSKSDELHWGSRVISEPVD